MYLITSAAYLDQEFSSEFGRLPPAFLPVGNRRLYTYQVAALPSDERIVLTLPENFEIPAYDQHQLQRLNVEIQMIPEGLSLGESVICALNLIGHAQGPLRILHGDTLIYDLPVEQSDVITLSEVDDNYSWAVYQGDEDAQIGTMKAQQENGQREQMVVNGYFSFSDSRLLIQSITRCRGRFIDGINHYARQSAITPVTCQRWFDFGHLHTYYRSKTHINTTRAFNEMAISAQTVTKRSNKRQKMLAEANWFEQIPADLRIYTPNYLGRLNDAEQPGYALEYLYLSALNELYVFGDLPTFVWRKIFTACTRFLQSCRQHLAPSHTKVDPHRLFGEKTEQRLADFSQRTGIDLDTPWQLNGQAVPSLREIGEQALKRLPQSPCASVIHGDFCFSNILYDFRTQALKVIDPRGLDADDELSIFGNPHYDIAKLAHSVIGRYDFIIAGYFHLEQLDANQLNFTLPNNQAHDSIEDLFLAICVENAGLTRTHLIAMQIHLFLSMLPLHEDNPQRQMALMANALRLYQMLEIQ